MAARVATPLIAALLLGGAVATAVDAAITPPSQSTLLFSTDTESLPDVGLLSGDWAAYLPNTGEPALTAISTPTVTSLGGVKWVESLYADGDGFRFGGEYVAPIPCSGATIVAAVTPVRNNESWWSSVVNVFFRDLMLNVRNTDGVVQVVRHDVWYDGPPIPENEPAILSAVVQPDGQLKLFINGGEAMSVTDLNAYTQMTPGPAAYEKFINLGRNNPDGWSTYNGLIGDVFVYTSALSDTDRADLEGQLADKFINAAANFTITASADAGGTISPSGDVTVIQGLNQTFSFVPDGGKSPYQVTIDGGAPVAAGPSYTFTDVQDNHTIHVTFQDDPDSDPDLLFSARSNTYGGAGAWSTVYPVGGVLNPIASPSLVTINGEDWMMIQRGAGGDDGFELAGIPGLGGGVAASGASIVVAVRPIYPIGVGGEARGEIVSLYYNGLVLASDHDTGEVMIARKAWDWRRTGYFIPNGQITVLSLVAQLDGSCTLYANGVEEWTGEVLGDGYYARLEGSDTGWMTRVGVGRNPWDGWSSFNGNIGDVYVYKVAIDDTKRTNLEASLTSKFGTALNYTITASAGAGGYIDPVGVLDVPEYSDKVFTITPDTYFDVTSVLIDGTDEMIAGPDAQSYTMYDVVADGTIDASFTEWALTEITGKVTSDGVAGVPDIVVTASGGREPYTVVSADPDGSFSIRVKPGVGYTVTAAKAGWSIVPSSVFAGPGDLVGKDFVATYVGAQKLVDMKVDSLAEGLLTSWPNDGVLGGQFVADGGKDTIAPTVVADYLGKKAVQFNNNKMMLSSTFDTGDGSLIRAPEGITGNGVWTVYAQVCAVEPLGFEQYYLAWAHNGNDGNCAAFGYGFAPAWGAVAHWGWTDMGWNSPEMDGGPTIGEWHHVAVTFDGATEKVYLDGSEVNSEGKTLALWTANPFCLGSRMGWDDNGWGREWPLNGALAAVQVYDLALSAEEIAALSSDFNPDDTDADSLSDAWEMGHVGNLTDLDGTLTGPGPGAGTGDFDGDGTSDLAEFLLGLIPNDPSSFFAATIVRDPGTGEVTLSWPNQGERTFKVLATDDLTLPKIDWFDLGEVYGVDGETTATFSETPIAQPRSFYQVILLN